MFRLIDNYIWVMIKFSRGAFVDTLQPPIIVEIVNPLLDRNLYLPKVVG